MYNDHIKVILICEIIIKLIFLDSIDFVVHLKLKTIKFIEKKMLETTNSRTQGSLHFVEIKIIGANEEKYFHSI